jgi:hypothetical protein
VPEIAADLDDVEALSRAFGVAWDRVEAAQHRFRRAAITGEALGRPDLSAACQGANGSTVAAVETLRQGGCGRPTAREGPTSMSGRSRTCCSDSVAASRTRSAPYRREAVNFSARTDDGLDLIVWYWSGRITSWYAKS